MFSAFSPVSSLHARRGGETGEIFECSPVSFPPCPPNLRLERQGGYLSPLLVEWLSFAVFLLARSLRLPCLVERSRCCERGSSR